MKKKLIVALSVSAFALTVFSGCSTPSSSTTASEAPSASPSETASQPEDVSSGTTGLGEIIVNGKGMTAYVFAKDVAGSGVSACVEECVATWPAITTESAAPIVTNLNAEISTIKTADGRNQITVNGLPIYTFVKDAAVGDTKGQLVKDAWFALTPTGEKITTPNAQ